MDHWIESKVKCIETNENIYKIMKHNIVSTSRFRRYINIPNEYL